jgi:hypothetical protein
MINGTITNKHLPIIIGGFYRSGTSLVRRLLDSHSRIHCGPEVKFFKDFYGDYLHDELRYARLFSTLPSLGLTEEEILSIYGRAFVESHEIAARKAGKVRWADKNPENVLYLKQWTQLLPGGFVFLQIVRNPLDILASLKEIGFDKAVPTAFADKVRMFKVFRDAGAAYAARHPEPSLTLRYEDIVQAPLATLECLFSWLGETFEPEVLERFNLPERGEGIEDPKVKMTQNVHGRSIGRWRQDLTEKEIYTTQSILGDTDAEFPT